MQRKRTIVDASSAILLAKAHLFRCLTESLLGFGRYSQKIVSAAADTSRERLGRFLPP